MSCARRLAEIRTTVTDRRVVPVQQTSAASLAHLFACPCISPAGMWQAGKQEGVRAGRRTQARSDAEGLKVMMIR